ncbi:hypothetical protein EON65_39135 [archaeon]|nr:MAG: hypothetical protein EON65_39135 [archaeon]
MGEVPQSTKAKQRRLDQMLEAQMISDILRAHNNLRAFNTFRVSHEASHREKELAEARKKEIQEPLEAAVFENELLHGKVTRREEVICDLRRELLLENIRSKTATLCSREGGTRNQLPTASHPHIDVNQSDEYKINQMKDEIAELHLIIEHQDRELDTCRKAMSSQSKKIKELRDVAEQSEYTFQERIRKIDSDKDIYLGMIESRENKIEKLMEENDELNEQVNELNETVDKAKGAKVHAQKMMEEYKEKAVEAIKIKEEAEGKFNEYVEQIKVLREENFEYSEKISDLQTR